MAGLARSPPACKRACSARRPSFPRTRRPELKHLAPHRHKPAVAWCAGRGDKPDRVAPDGGGSTPDSNSPADAAYAAGGAAGAAPGADSAAASEEYIKQEGASTNLSLIWSRLVKLVSPYWIDNPDAGKARIALVSLVALSLLGTGVSVAFNFLGRDFFNALSAKDATGFNWALIKYLGAFIFGIPVFVFRDYFTSLLALRWRQWMTEDLLSKYMAQRTFYNIQAQQVVDNPDQRLTSDINQFTSSTLSLAFTFLTSVVDLISFSGILFSIYPPLFVVLVVYSVGGTFAAYLIGKKLVGLNFAQEATEADLRYGLVRVRENAESIAFYNGATSEIGLLVGRLGRVVANYKSLLTATRNLDFFQTYYRYVIILLPAAVVAPLFFRGDITFGVISQSQSAFSHVLSDVSLVVYQFENLASYSAVVDRLGEFQEAIEARGKFNNIDQPRAAPALPAPVELQPSAEASAFAAPRFVKPFSEIEFEDSATDEDVLVAVNNLTLCTPNYSRLLIRGLELEVARSTRLLVMGVSGCGKTSLLRAIAGLWTSGEGSIRRPATAQLMGPEKSQGMMFVPQRPYTVLGSLRAQLLYPVYDRSIVDEALQPYKDEDDRGSIFDPLTAFAVESTAATAVNGTHDASAAATEKEKGPVTEAHLLPEIPEDSELEKVLEEVGLGQLLARFAPVAEGSALDAQADWSSTLSLGEQQRLAFARVFLAHPALVLLDESTSALDADNERRLYGLLRSYGIAYVSVGHRMSLKNYHDCLLTLSPTPDEPKNWQVSGVDRVDELVTAGVAGGEGEVAGPASAQ